MDETDDDPIRVSRTLPTLQELHDGAVLEFEPAASMRLGDMIAIHLAGGTERTLTIESVERDDVITAAAVHARIGFVHVILIAEASSKGRRWKVEYGPGREDLDLA